MMRRKLAGARSSLPATRVCLGWGGLGLLLFWSALASSQEIVPPPPTPTPALSTPGVRKSSTPTASRDDAPSPFRITGRVINSLSQAAVGKAEITVSPMGVRRGNSRFASRSAARTVTALADASGRFEVELPSAGGWSVTAAAHGYHTQAFEEHDGYSTAIILTEAKPAYSLTFPLTPAAAIEGYVLDEAGEAVRNAQLTLGFLPPATPDDQHPRRQSRGNQKTDDRGCFKFAGLLSGSYVLRVQAQPWYASSAAGNRGGGIGGIVGGNGAANASSGASSAPDPLDVVYAPMWFPGVTDFAAATPITLHGGETRQADFRLLPIPGFHLRIATGQGATEGDGSSSNGGGQIESRGIRNNGYLSQVLPDGTEAAMQVAIHTDAQGNVEYSGLAPGTYVLHREGEYANAGAGSETVKISANSARTVDLGQASLATLVTVKIDAAADKPSLRINFRDVESGRVSYAVEKQSFRTGGPTRMPSIGDPADLPQTASVKDASPAIDRTVSLQPGRYEVVLNGVNDLYLTSIEAAEATAIGRQVTIGAGAPVLTLHVASGRANVTGTVQLQGRPLEGAMVLLVPATLGDPAGLAFTQRDQSNTDGSFDITGVIPGAYILVAIDHGWEMNWSDPATLRRFLMQGMPLDLTNGGDHKATIEAKSP